MPCSQPSRGLSHAGVSLLTKPSDLRLTFRMIPNEPAPVHSQLIMFLLLVVGMEMEMELVLDVQDGEQQTDFLEHLVLVGLCQSDASHGVGYEGVPVAVE